MEKDLGIPVDEKFGMTWVTDQKAHCILGCIKRAASRMREGIWPLLFVLATLYLEYHI